MCNITSVICVLNILPYKRNSLSSDSAVVITCLDLVCLSGSVSLERGEKWVFIPIGLLYQHGRMT